MSGPVLNMQFGCIIIAFNISHTMGPKYSVTISHATITCDYVAKCWHVSIYVYTHYMMTSPHPLT